ncbi:hypothetical protein UlMin_011413 [Ulmus minor]
MEETFVPFCRIKNDLQGRFMCYKKNGLVDLRQALVTILTFLKILAPATYIFSGSEIPVISFGEQLERNTGIQCLVNTLQCDMADANSACQKITIPAKDTQLGK